MSKNKTIIVKGVEITIIKQYDNDYISLTDMLKAKDGDFFISDWLRNRNTVEFLGIWESVYNPGFNYGEFATIKTQAGLNNYKISAKEWQEKTNAIGRAVEYGEYQSRFNPSAINTKRTSATIEQNSNQSNEIAHRQ